MLIKPAYKFKHFSLDQPFQANSLAQAFFHQARLQPHALAVCDSLGFKLTYGQLLVRAIALANLLKKTLNSTVCVGIMLPPSAGSVIANLAVSFLGKVAVNLNYTAGQKAFDHYIESCGIKHIITAKPAARKINLEYNAKLIFIESVEKEADFLTKLKSATESSFLPESFVGEFLHGLSDNHRINSEELGLRKQTIFPGKEGKINDPAVVIFTAGSTSEPKGVVLSHSNILSNIRAIKEQGQIKSGEILLGIIPFFHSFGLTMTLWAPLCLGETVVYHYDPFDARRIGELSESFKATCFVCTPTMMNIFARRLKKEQFSSLRNCIVGGEKLSLQQSQEIEQFLGFAPIQGYGLAETSPVVACNVPNHVTTADGRVIEGNRIGTVGLPIPGTAIRITDVNTGAELKQGQAGLISVKGPQVMLGYLKQPQATAKAIKDDWFNTGDIGFLDEDGFLTITGRLSQFSKVAGEMISHIVVEDAILDVAGAQPGSLSVTAVPDDKRGERLVAVYSNMPKDPKTVVDELRQGRLPNLWIPNADDFIQVDKLPVLENGKLNLKEIKQIALMQQK